MRLLGPHFGNTGLWEGYISSVAEFTQTVDYDPSTKLYREKGANIEENQESHGNSSSRKETLLVLASECQTIYSRPMSTFYFLAIPHSSVEFKIVNTFSSNSLAYECSCEKL